MSAPLLVALYVLFPVLAIYLCYRFPVANKIGIVVICYAAGLALGNIGLIPESLSGVQGQVSEVTVAVALPLLLFSLDVRRWFRLAGRTILSMVLATIAILIVASVGYLLIKTHVSQAWQVAGMAVSVYTGGTPNLAAIKTALGVESARFIILHSYDIVASMVYLVFCITVAQGFFNLFLRRFRSQASEADGEAMDMEHEDIHSYEGMFLGKRPLHLLLALALSAGIVGVSLGIGSLVPKDYGTALIILAITTLGIGASFVKKIRSIERSFQLGMYIIYIFCFTVGSMANFRTVIHIDPYIMGYIALCVFGSMAIHAVLCKIFGVDADTFIITSVSAICSPPFVPVVARALKNREVILSGLTTGIIGYAIGNYLGITLGILLEKWF